MTRRELQPAMIGSVLLHVAVSIALLISWNFSRTLKVGEVTPVTIVAHAPVEPKPIEQAPVEQQAQAEEPQPQAEPQPPPPPPPKPQPTPAKPAPTPPKPTPVPPKPVPTPKPAPAKAEPPPKPAPPPPKTAAPAKPQKSLDLDALSASISSLNKPAKPAAAAKGPTQAQTAPVARQTMGAGEAQAALQGLTDELQRRWNPNCDVEGGRDVQVQVAFTVGQGGQVVGDASAQIKGPSTPVARTAAERAVSAVYAAAPFRRLPQEFYGQRIKVNFNAREACS